MKIVSYKLAKLAKENGFDWDCDNGYNIEGERFGVMYYDSTPNNTTLEDDWYSLCDGKPCCTAPYQSQLQKWFRENHKLHMMIGLTDDTLEYYYYVEIINSNKRWYDDINMMDQASEIEVKGKFDTYEAALEAGLKELFKYIK